ncbi:MAG: hypothetical protein ACTSXG_01345, partial [Alphaproteobacteria bacterium]
MRYYKLLLALTIVCVSFLSLNAMEEKNSNTQQKPYTHVQMQEENIDSNNILSEIKKILGNQHENVQKWENWLDKKNIVLEKKALKEIQNFFFPTQKTNTVHGEIFEMSFLALKNLDELPRKIFQAEAVEYFSKYFKDIKDIKFEDKKGGDQMGNEVHITFQDNSKRIYYAKTHRGGLKSQHSSSSKPVDLKELLIYKVLEYCELGPEVHFFGNNEKDFYIATLDAGFDDKNQKQGTFTKYSTIIEKTSSEELVKNPYIVNGFIKADFISRILLLSDVLNNGGNTGLSSNNQFKIIDFNPPVTREYLNEKIFIDWLSGNNQYNYQDTTVISIIKKEEKQEKIQMSKAVIMEGFKNF